MSASKEGSRFVHFGNLELEVNGRRSNVILHDNIKIFTKASMWQHSPETGSSGATLFVRIRVLPEKLWQGTSN